MPAKKSSIQLDPSPYSARSNPPALIPLYYTSELFVDPLREDISDLLTAFAEHFEEGKEPPSEPFSLFKTIWIDQGWDIFHLKCDEPRSRWTFLKTVFRCFIERIEKKESGAVQAAALFGLYTFYGTQPDPSTGYTYLNKIPIAIDTYVYVLTLPEVVPQPLSNHVLYVLKTFIEDETFTILPDSSLHPYQTRDLPNATLVPYEYTARDGRPTKPQLVARTRHAVNKLDNWVQAMDAAKVPDTLDAFSGMEEEREGQVGSSTSASNTPQAGPSTGLPSSSTEQSLEYPVTKAKGRKKGGTSTSAQLDFTPPDMSSYVDLKSKLKDLVPPDILHAAEADTRRTMEGMATYARDNDIAPESGWDGAKRVQEQDGLLDFVKGPPQATASGGIDTRRTEDTMEIDEH
ncbi:hypothetical protein FRC05_005242 [Tulasnella sp. 425]|nr:hypothetical protein FRC05_005242 [Tulasnella sp. 425]